MNDPEKMKQKIEEARNMMVSTKATWSVVIQAVLNIAVSAGLLQWSGLLLIYVYPSLLQDIQFDCSSLTIHGGFFLNLIYSVPRKVILKKFMSSL